MRRATYTAAELLAMELPCLPKTISGIGRRAKGEHWPRTYERVRGGHQHSYLSEHLPAEVQTAITMHELKRDGNLALAVTSQLPVKAVSKEAKQLALTEAQIKNALAKDDLVKRYAQWMAAAPWGKKEQARADFLLAYEADAWPLLRELLGDVSWQTIERWKGEIARNGDCLHLADRRGKGKKGTTAVTPEQFKVVLAFALHPNQLRIAEAIRRARVVMRARGMDGDSHHDATYRRLLEAWKGRNIGVWTFTREGKKAWNDNCAKDIVRDISLIPVGAVLVADGHTLNFTASHPLTGQPCRLKLIVWKDMRSNYPLGWVLAPEEDTAAIHAALRWAIIRLGKYPWVAYLDNGKAFRAKHFKGSSSFEEMGISGLYERLGMKTIHAWPYHGQSKTVERFFGTFAELERLCPTYTGTSIANKPARMHRGETLHRKVFAKAFGDGCLSYEQANLAIATWFDEYAQRPQSGHLAGACPLEVFEAGQGPGVDRAELDFLMMSLSIKHINKNGIRFRKQDYYAPALCDRRHPVLIRYDYQDPSRLLVYEPDGEFLCEALPPDMVHPAAFALGTEADQAKLTAQIEYKKGQEKDASALCRQFLEQEIIPAEQERLAAIGLLPEPGPAQDAKRNKVIRIKGCWQHSALPAPEMAGGCTMNEAETKAAMAEAEAAIAAQGDFETGMIRQRLSRMTEPERYEELIEMQVRGQLLCREWQAFIDYFETTQYYAQRAAYYDDLRARTAIMYQMEG